MKKKFSLFISIFFIAIGFSQNHTTYNGLILNIGNNYEPAEIVYSDGTVEKGHINGFIENNNIEFGMASQFSSLEHQLNIDDKKFYFKKNTDDKAIALKKEQLKSVTIYQGNIVKKYHLLNLKTISKGEIVDLNRKVWLPLLLEDSNISVFGFNLFINKKYVFTYIYISKDNQNAFKPSDDKFAGNETIISSSKIMLKHIFNNCEKMNPLIDESLDIEKGKNRYRELKSAIKEVKNRKELSKVEREELILSLNQNYFTEPYSTMIEEYKKSCSGKI